MALIKQLSSGDHTTSLPLQVNLPLPMGLILGGLAFTASLSPSLIPRTGATQGLVAGLAFMLAYGVVSLLVRTYKWLGFPPLVFKHRRKVDLALYLIAFAIILTGLFKVTAWQNSIHRAMKIAPVESARPVVIALAALATIFVILIIVRLVKRVAIMFARQLSKYLPQRAALLSAFLAAVFLSWSIGNGVIQRVVLRSLDNSYRELDAIMPPDHAAPVSDQLTGGPGSLIAWSNIGREGRNRILHAPSQREIAEVTGKPALQPIRVYVGLNSAETSQQRANLAVAELIRQSAFDRSTLVIATPTGTGWVDPAGMAPLEMLTGGDVSTVSVQYSYVPSWMSLFIDPEAGIASAKDVFDAVYSHWRKLPADTRPRLFLFGLSLGALNTERSFEFQDILGAPFDGALLVGPPYSSPMWRDATNARLSGSPVWLPVVGDQSLFRFQNQSRPASTDRVWGALRIVYLQYASDPIVFLDTHMLWRKPEWLNDTRGPDVSPKMQWIPLVTFLQVVCDAVIATSTTFGTGHVYAGEHYLSAWNTLIRLESDNVSELSKIEAWLKKQNSAGYIDVAGPSDDTAAIGNSRVALNDQKFH